MPLTVAVPITTDAISTVAASSTAQTIAPATYGLIDITLTGNCTITITSPPSGRAYSATIILRQDGTGSRTVTWPASVKWPGGVAPNLSTAASAYDIVTITTVDGGTTWLGFVGGKAFA